MKAKENMISKRIGNITEMSCMLAFIKLGYNVLSPYGDCEKYDFVADINGVFYKIQIKTASTINEKESFSFDARSNRRLQGKIIHSTYSKNEIDFFATFYKSKCYLIPIEEVHHGKSLRLTDTKNNQSKGISYAKDYEIEVSINKYCIANFKD